MSTQRLLRAGRLEEDSWRYIESDQELPPEGGVVVSWQRWQSLEGNARSQRPIGICLEVDQEPAILRPALDVCPLVAIRFPAFNDGRGLSLAVLLRTRFGYRGELRAIGATHEDITHYLLRCGFDSILYPEGRDLSVALTGIAMSDFYQASVVEPQPAFRRMRRGTG